jgi:hypothetical protein
MIIVDEERLSDETLIAIARDYDMIEKRMTDGECIEKVIERFMLDIDDLKERMANIIKGKIKIEWNLV